MPQESRRQISYSTLPSVLTDQNTMIGENWKLHHVGIPVRNLDQSLDDYQSFGELAWFGEEFFIDSSQAAQYLVYGKQPDPVVQTRGVMGRVGPIGVELLQPVQGNTVHKELLDSVGEGVGHIAYAVPDLEA